MLLTTAEEVLGRLQEKIQPDLCNRRQELRGRKHASEEAWTKYQWVHREVRKMRAAKEEWIEEWIVPLRKAWKPVSQEQLSSKIKMASF